MKTILSLALLTMFGTAANFAQNTDNVPNPILCGAAKSGDVISYADLAKCDELTLPYKELKVKSFVLSYAVKSTDGQRLFVEHTNSGAKLSDAIKAAIKTLEAKKVEKVLIENVVVLEQDGTERKMTGLDIRLE